MQTSHTKLVLIVDEESEQRQRLANALRLIGCQVFTDQTNEDALRSIARDEPQLVIISAGAHGGKVDGYGLARELHSRLETRFIPVIIRPDELNATEEDISRDAHTTALTYVLNSTNTQLLLARASTLLAFKAQLDSFRNAAFTDALSRLANRRQFEEQLEAEVMRTQRYARPFCLIILDIDHFKRVNDTYGHDTGDEVIKEIGRILQTGARTNDLVARIGGEEFALLLPETELEKAQAVAERLRTEVARASFGAVGQITISLGVAEFPLCACTGQALFKAADDALYEAKTQGRNKVVTADMRHLVAA